MAEDPVNPPPIFDGCSITIIVGKELPTTQAKQVWTLLDIYAKNANVLT